MGFELKGVKVIGQKSTIDRDNFINLLITKGGFFKLENNRSDYQSFRYKMNDWLFVRAYPTHYQVHLTGDYDMYTVRKQEYNVLTSQPEGFMQNNILKNI